MTRKEHLQATAKHHKSMSRIFKILADGNTAVADSSDNAEHAAAHRVLAEAFGAGAAEHTAQAETCEECAKAMDTDDLEKGGDDLTKLAPWPGIAMIPSDVPVRKILRPGQPDYSEGNPAANLPDIFQKLTVLDENEV